MLIAKITDSDFFGGEPQYVEDDARYNVRGVLTDGKGNIALLKVENSEYYKLPGGSIEISERPNQAFVREIEEQTGYASEITGYLGWIEEHKNKRNSCMVSHCYVAKISDDAKKSENINDNFEWIEYNKALMLLKNLFDDCKVYRLMFMLKREYLILQTAKDLVIATKEN